MSQHRKEKKPPPIKIREGALHILADEGESALILAGVQFYVRFGLVRPIIDKVTASQGYKTTAPRLKDVSLDYMTDQLSRSAIWLKLNKQQQKFLPADPPKNVASVILARDGEWKFPQLSGIITTPTLRPDGSILSKPGYDEQTQLLLLDPPELPAIPEYPTRDEALAAIQYLESLLDEFEFVDAASRSVALSGFLTTIVRGALLVVPMHISRAPSSGSGKSFLVDLWAALATGNRAPVISAGAGDDETDKRVGGDMLKGQPIINIDNVNGKLGSDALCQMVERPLVTMRILGTSRTVSIENRATIFANGNNVMLVGDMTRRVITCSLDTNIERPELREFRNNPFDQILSDRGRYIAAALTVVRAYAAAGYPSVLRPLASFEDWSQKVRSALVWLGYADPVETMAETRATDPVISWLARLFITLHQIIGTKSYTSGNIVKIADELDSEGKWANPDLRAVLLEITQSDEGEISPIRLGTFLTRHKDRVVEGFKLVGLRDAHIKQLKWSLIPVAPIESDME